MLKLQWPLVIGTTLAFYFLIILCLPFSSVYASIFLFALIAFWTRLPGVGIPHPLFILYNMDMIDVFAILISIYVGPIQGGVFAAFLGLWGRFCGVWPPEYVGVIKDSIFQGVLCLFIPFVYQITGSLIITTIFYTLARSALFLITGIFFPHRPFSQQIVVEIACVISLLFFNGFYMTFLGSFAGNLLERGVEFSWPLFIFATIVIGISYLIFFRKNEKKPGIGKIIKKVVTPKPKHISVERQPMEQIYQTK